MIVTSDRMPAWCIELMKIETEPRRLHQRVPVENLSDVLPADLLMWGVADKNASNRD
jgi:hypothetical protein